MKSPARLGESAPSTSTPSTGVETRSAGEGAGGTLMRRTLGDPTDITRTTPRLGSWGDRDSSAGGSTARRSAAPCRHVPRRHGRRHRRAGHQLVVPRRRAHRLRHRAAHRAGGARARRLEVRRRAGLRGVLYLSVLLHEVSHALMAQRFGYVVNSITLHFLGGMTEIEGEAAQARAQEFWIAVVGPLTSLAVGRGRRRRCGSSRPTGCSGSPSRASPAPTCWSASSTSSPGCRSTAAACSRPSSGASPATRTAAPSSPAGAAGSPRSPCSPGRCVQREVFGVDAGPVRLRARRSCSRSSCGPAPPRPCPRPGSADGCRTWSRAPLARRTLAVPEDLPLAEAVRRAQEAGAGSIVTIDRRGPRRPASSTRPPCWPPPRSAARGSPSRPSRAPSRTGSALPADDRGRGADPGDQPTPRRRVPPARGRRQIFGVLATADVDRAFRETAALTVGSPDPA